MDIFIKRGDTERVTQNANIAKITQIAREQDLDLTSGILLIMRFVRRPITQLGSEYHFDNRKCKPSSPKAANDRF
ncbi:hypothetical protein ACROYT_G019510 [Oculina patagonica]